MPTQAEKARTFQSLHARSHAFVIPNPWDPGSAHLLAQMGFEALATTSGGFAFSQGVRDNAVGRDRMLAHVATIARATDLPVSGDLENGFGDFPEVVADTIRRAAAAGLVGGSIEDATGRPDAPIYDHTLAVERIHAAAEAARALPFPFTLTARAENFLVGRRDLHDTINRLQAYQDAGADVLFAPGLASEEDIAAVVQAVDRPVNVIAGAKGMRLTLADLSRLGVKRVSVGSALARAAYTALLTAGREIREHGTFLFADRAVSYQEFMELMNP